MSEWIICPQCWDAWQGKIGALCSICGIPTVTTPLFPTEPTFILQWFGKGKEMKCPECQAKVSTKHYDADLEMYECPKCEHAFGADEAEEAENGTSPKKRSTLVAKGKKRRTEIADDEKAIEEHEKEILKPKVAKDPQATKHRDQVATAEILNIVADEIQEIGHETGVEIDRLNAREFYAMNLVRPLLLSGVTAREKDVPMVKCGEHS